MTLIEVRGRGGQLIERVRCEDAVIRIGRAFDNEVIVSDPYVCPHHLRLVAGEDGWQVEDLSSQNGVHLRRRKTAQSNTLSSGDHLRIGHTELHVFDPHHPVLPALKMDGAEARLARLGAHWLWPLLLCLTGIMLVAVAYQSSFNEFKPASVFQPALWSVLGVAMVAAVWALMGRLIKHRSYFFAHLSIWFLFGLCLELSDYAAGVIAYNASSALLQTVLSTGLNFLLLVIAVGASISLATTLINSRRLWASVGTGLLLLAVQLAGEMRWSDDFSPSPDYYARLQKPALLWVTPQPETVMGVSVPKLMARARQAADEATQAN